MDNLEEFTAVLQRRIERLESDRLKVVEQHGGPFGLEYTELVYRKAEAKAILATLLETRGAANNP